MKLRDADVVWQDVEGEIVVLDMRASMYLTVKGSGAFLWPMLVSGTSQQDLVQALVQRYSIPEHQAEQDVGKFLGGLEQRGLLDA